MKAKRKKDTMHFPKNKQAKNSIQKMFYRATITVFMSTAILTPLLAQDQSKPGAGGAFGMFLPLIIMFVIFYFLLIRPNQKKEKQRQKMINELQKGDKVITSGGIFGLVVAVKPEENKVVLKIADNTKVEFAKSAVTTKIE